jgi:2-polyprenyl-3-methyl-5-hydroxy-6-metoxy-1,4-benzoquinol methylase
MALDPPSSVFEQHYRKSSADFWHRFGGQPDVAGKRVFDFGCSTGGMVHRLMKAGAVSAVGVDLSDRAIAYASERLPAEWGDRVEIYKEDVRKLDFEAVDLLVSQNTLEHVMALDETLAAVLARCKPGADLYFGFSPLWYSPFGHHHYPRTRLPWLHVLKGDKVVLDAFRERVGKDYASIEDAGFNRATPDDFRTALSKLPVEIISARRNIGASPLRTLMSRSLLIPAVIRPLEKYLTVGMYWHLRKLPEPITS